MAFGGLKGRRKSEKRKGTQSKADVAPAASTTAASSVDLPLRKNTKFVSGFGRSRSEAPVTPVDKASISSKPRADVEGDAANDMGSPQGSIAAPDSRRRFRMPSGISLKNKRSFNRSVTVSDRLSTQNPLSSDDLTPATPRSVSAYGLGPHPKQTDGTPGTPGSGRVIPGPNKNDKDKDTKGIPAFLLTDKSKIFASGPLVRKKSAASLRSEVAPEKPGEIITLNSPLRSTSFPASPVYSTSFPSIPTSTRNGLAPSISGAGLNLPLASYQSPGETVSKAQETNTSSSILKASNALSYLTTSSAIPITESADLTASTVVHHSPKEPALSRMPEPLGTNGDDTASLFESDEVSIDGTYSSHNGTIMYDAMDTIDGGSVAHGGLATTSNAEQADELNGKDLSSFGSTTAILKGFKDPFQPSDDTSFKMKKIAITNEKGQGVSFQDPQTLKAAPGINKGKSVERPIEAEEISHGDISSKPPPDIIPLDFSDPQTSGTSASTSRNKVSLDTLAGEEPAPPTPAKSIQEAHEQSNSVERVKENLAKNGVGLLDPVAASGEPSKSYDASSSLAALKHRDPEDHKPVMYSSMKASIPPFLEAKEPIIHEKNVSERTSELPNNAITLAPVAKSQAQLTDSMHKQTPLPAMPTGMMPDTKELMERMQSAVAPTKQDFSSLDEVVPSESGLAGKQRSKEPTKSEVAPTDSAPKTELETTTNAPELEATNDNTAHQSHNNPELDESPAQQSAAPAISGGWSNLLPLRNRGGQSNEVDKEATQANGSNASESLSMAASAIAGATTGTVLSSVYAIADTISPEQDAKPKESKDEARGSSNKSEGKADTGRALATVSQAKYNFKNETFSPAGESSTNPSFVLDVPRSIDDSRNPENDAAILEDEASSEYTTKDEADTSVHMENKPKDQASASTAAPVSEPLVNEDTRPVSTVLVAAPIESPTTGTVLPSVSNVVNTSKPTMHESGVEEISSGPVPVEPLRLQKRGNVDTVLPVAPLPQEPELPAKPSAGANETPQVPKLGSDQASMPPTSEQSSEVHSIATPTQQTSVSDKLVKASDDSNKMKPKSLDESEPPKRRNSLFKAAGEFLGNNLPFSRSSRLGDEPKNTSKSATEESKPESKPKPEPKPEPEWETKPEPKPEPELETKPEPKPEPELETKPESKPEPELETKSESKPEPEVKLESKPALEPQAIQEPLSQPRNVSAMDHDGQLLVRQTNLQDVTADRTKHLPADDPKPEQSIPVSQPMAEAAPTLRDEVKPEAMAKLPLAAPETHHEPIMPQSAASPELPHRPMFAPLVTGTTLPWAMGTMPLPHRTQGMMQGTMPAVPSASMTGVDDELPTPPEPFQPPEPPAHHKQPDPTQLVQPPQEAVQPAVSFHAVPGEIVPSRFAQSSVAQSWPPQEPMEPKPDLNMPAESTQPFVSGPPLPEKEEANGLSQQAHLRPALASSVAQSLLWQPNEDEHDLAEEEPSRRYTLETQPEPEPFGSSFEPRFLHTVPEEHADISGTDTSQIDVMAGVKDAAEPVAAPALSMQAPNLFSVNINSELQGTGQYDPHQVRGFMRAMDTDNYEHAIRRASRMGVPLDVIPSNSPVPYPDPPEDLPRPSELFAGKGVRWDSPDWLRSQLRKNVEAPSQAKFHAFLKTRRQIIPAFVWHDATSDPALHGEEYVDLAAPSNVSANEPVSEPVSVETRRDDQQPLQASSKTENKPLPVQDTVGSLQEAADIVPTLPLLLPDSYLLSDSDPIETSLLNLDELERSYQNKVHPPRPKESNEFYAKYPYNSASLANDQAVVTEVPPSLPPKIPSPYESTPNRLSADVQPWNEQHVPAPFTQPQFMPPAPHAEMSPTDVYQQQFVPLVEQGPEYDGGLQRPTEYAHDPRLHHDEQQDNQGLPGPEYDQVPYPEPVPPNHCLDAGFSKPNEHEHTVHPYHQPVEPHIQYGDPAFGAYAGDSLGPYPGQFVPFHDPAMHGLQPDFIQPYPGPDPRLYQMPMQPRPDLHTQPFLQQASVPHAHISPYQQFPPLSAPQHEPQPFDRDQEFLYDEYPMDPRQAWQQQQFQDQQLHPEFSQYEPHRFVFAQEEQAYEDQQPQFDYSQQQKFSRHTWDDRVVSASAPPSPVGLRDPHLTSDVTNTSANAASVAPGWHSPAYQSLNPSGVAPMLSSTPSQKYDTKRSKRRGGASHRSGWAALLHSDPLSALQ